MLQKTIRKTGAMSLLVVAPLVLALSLVSCVPLVIVGGAIVAGAVADEGFNYKPGLEGSADRSSQEDSYDAPGDYGGAGEYNMPVY